MEMPRIKCNNLEFRSLKGGVCDACVKSYCSCSGHAEVSFLQGDHHRSKHQQEIPWDECIIHSHCSFCTRSLDEDCVYGQNDRSVKRKLARICTHGDKLDRSFWEDAAGDDVVLPKKGKSDGIFPPGTFPGYSSGEEELENLKAALQAERETVRSLYLELENERNAATIAAVQAMSKINSLQEEKTAVLREAREFQLAVEAKIMHDEEAIDMLNEILVLQEEKKAALEREVQIYKTGDTKMRDFSSPESNMEATARRNGRNLMDAFHAAGQGGGLPRNYNRMDVDDDGGGAGTASSVHDVYEVPPSQYHGATTGPRFTEEDGLENYASRGRPASHRGYDRLGKPDSVLHTNNGRPTYDHHQRASGHRDGDLVTELRRLNSRLQVLEAEREYQENSYGSKGGGGGGMNNEFEVLEEIAQQLRHFQALEKKQDDIKDLPEGSFVFSFKGIFSFNGLRQSLHSQINRLACMFLKHSDAGLSYGDNHVGLSHLLESSRKMNRNVPCITRGIKMDQAAHPPGFGQQRQNMAWPMDARGRSETAFGGWDY